MTTNIPDVLLCVLDTLRNHAIQVQNAEFKISNINTFYVECFLLRQYKYFSGRRANNAENFSRSIRNYATISTKEDGTHTLILKEEFANTANCYLRGNIGQQSIPIDPTIYTSFDFLMQCFTNELNTILDLYTPYFRAILNVGIDGKVKDNIIYKVLQFELFCFGCLVVDIAMAYPGKIHRGIRLFATDNEILIYNAPIGKFVVRLGSKPGYITVIFRNKNKFDKVAIQLQYQIQPTLKIFYSDMRDNGISNDNMLNIIQAIDANVKLLEYDFKDLNIYTSDENFIEYLTTEIQMKVNYVAVPLQKKNHL